MPMKYVYETEDPQEAARFMDFIAKGTGAVTATAQHTLAHPAASPALPPAAQAAPPIAPPAAVARPAPAAAPAPPPPPIAAALAAHDAEDQATLDAGWSAQHVKDAAAALGPKHGAAAAGLLQAALASFGAQKVSNLAPKHFPAVVAALQAHV